MDISALDMLRDRYLSDYPKYQELMELTRAQLKDLTQAHAIQCDVSGRVKEVASFLKKALKCEDNDPYSQIKDKCGIRIVAHLPWKIKDICQVIEERFEILSMDDKRVNQALQYFDYKGTHYDVRYPGAPVGLRDIVCEIQVLTRAESLWADTSHLFAYKPAQEPPDYIRRSVYRLAALLEIFDTEVERTYNTLLDQGFKEAQLLHILESQYYRFNVAQYNRELSIDILSVLEKIMDSELIEQFDSKMKEFVSTNEEKFIELYERHRDDDRANPLIWQPEVLLIFQQLQTNPFLLREVWEVQYPVELLVSLADTWGVAV